MDPTLKPKPSKLRRFLLCAPWGLALTGGGLCTLSLRTYVSVPVRTETGYLSGSVIQGRIRVVVFRSNEKLPDGELYIEQLRENSGDWVYTVTNDQKYWALNRTVFPPYYKTPRQLWRTLEGTPQFETVARRTDWERFSSEYRINYWTCTNGGFLFVALPTGPIVLLLWLWPCFVLLRWILIRWRAT